MIERGRDRGLVFDPGSVEIAQDHPGRMLGNDRDRRRAEGTMEHLALVDLAQRAERSCGDLEIFQERSAITGVGSATQRRT